MAIGKVLVGNLCYGDKGIFIGRPSLFGNPMKKSDVQPSELEEGESARIHSINTYGAYISTTLLDPTSPITRALKRLGKRVANGETLMLVCYCTPKPCHGHILAKVITGLATDEDFSI